MSDNEQYSKEVLICHLSLSLFFLVTLLSHLITIHYTLFFSLKLNYELKSSHTIKDARTIRNLIGKKAVQLRRSTSLIQDLTDHHNMKVQHPVQTQTGPEGSRRLRLPGFKTIGT